MKATNSAALPASSSTISVLPQPCSLPRSSPSTSRNIAPAIVAWPTGSSERGFGSLDSSTPCSVMASASTPIGTLTRKIHSQPSPVVSAPPTSGPIANEPPIVAPQTAIAPARSFGSWKAVPSRASATANRIAAPSPWTARAAISISMFPAAAHTTEVTVKSTRPTTNSRLRPSRSARKPALSTVLASASVYASTTHCRPARSVFRSAAMSDSAVLTTAMSSMSMAVGGWHTTASVQCLEDT